NRSRRRAVHDDIIRLHYRNFRQAIERLLVKPLQEVQNFFYNEKYYWQKVGRVTLQEVINLRGFDNRDKIFYNNERSILGTDVIKFGERESLLLLPVENLFITIEETDHKKFHADFDYRGKKFYRFSVGDLAVREKFADNRAGKYFFKDKATVVFSLTNPFHYNAECYKMLAQIF
ncbi:MAG: hypothetical protein IJP68_06920, partial [Selenomonadaceae bacterium]|nr:hypothetical protein [Selenomonadaceae bacterium]